MKPVSQTRHGFPGGNCFAACVASIFELEIDDVPDFLASATETGTKWTQGQWDAVQAFAATRGYRAFWLDPDTEAAAIEALKASSLHYIATGKSPRGEFGHCVVGIGERLVHDPAVAGPSRKSLDGEPWLYIGFLPEERVEKED